MATDETYALAGSERVASAREGLMLTVLLSAIFIAQFDFFVVNVAAPSLERDLHAASGPLELIVAGYAFAYAAGLITGGRLGDLYGFRRMFAIGMVAFGVASLLCGVAANPEQLVAARLLQGLTGAMMVPQVLALITATFPPARRARPVGLYAFAAGVGSIAGQVLGGMLLQGDVLGLGWRVIFLVNVPICAVGAALALRVLPRPEPSRGDRLDPLGALGIAAAVALVLVPLTLGRSANWPVWTWVALAAAVPVTAATLRWQRLLAERDRSPVIRLSLFRHPSFPAGLSANAAFMAYFASFMFALTLLLQHERGLSAFEAGLVFGPLGVTFTLSTLLGRRLVARYGLRVLLPASAVTAMGLLVLALHAEVAWILPSLALIGLGNGVVFPALVGAALVGVPPRHAGAAAGLLVTTQQFAGAVGVAAVGAIYFSHGMRWAALIDLGLVLAVMAAIVRLDQRSVPSSS